MVIFNGAAPPWDEINKSHKATSEGRGRKMLKGKWLSLDIFEWSLFRQIRLESITVSGSGLFSFHPLQVGKDEFGQIAAVTAFQHAEHRHTERAQGLAKPVKILRLQCTVADRIPHIRIKTGGHSDQLRLEIL